MEQKISDSAEAQSKQANSRPSKKRNKQKHQKRRKKNKLDKRLQIIQVAKKKKVLSYLDSWANRDESGDWKYCKSINNWLVKNWSAEDFMNEEQFKVFLDYVIGLESGSKARQVLLQRSEKLLKETSPEDKLYSRCRSLIQILI